MSSSKFLPSLLAALIFFGVALTTSAEIGDSDDPNFVGPRAPAAQDTLGIPYTPLVKLPIDNKGQSPDTWTISTYLAGMYRLIIALGAAVAVLMGIVGGMQYIASGITPGQKNEAKARINNAVIGLVIVLTSYLILNTIDPKLVKFEWKLPPISGTHAETTSTDLDVLGYSTCQTPNVGVGCCPRDTGMTNKCKQCSQCQSIEPDIPNKGCGIHTCFLNVTLLSKIRVLSKDTSISGWQITESWPPTVPHDSACHQDGTCADLNNTGGPTDPATIRKYYDAFESAGLKVLYESSNCTPYLAAGFTTSECKTYDTMTNGSSFHVRLQ